MKKKISHQKKAGIVFSALALLVLASVLVLCLPRETHVTSFGPAMQAHFGEEVKNASPAGFVQCEDGSFLVCDSALHVIWRVTETSSEIVCGALGEGDANGTVRGGYRDGAANEARFDTPVDILPYRNGYLISDSLNAVVRFWDPEKAAVVTFAGTGERARVDGTVEKASFLSPCGMCADEAGNVYVADTLSHTIRKIDTSGYVSTFLGAKQGNLDGSFDVACLSYPVDIVCMDEGFAIADRGNASVRAVRAGELVTLFSDKDLAQGTLVNAFSPEALCYENGTLLVADSGTRTVWSLKKNAVTPACLASQSDELFCPVGLWTDGERLFVSSAESPCLEVVAK